jgi:hypothetical protein
LPADHWAVAPDGLGEAIVSKTLRRGVTGRSILHWSIVYLRWYAAAFQRKSDRIRINAAEMLTKIPKIGA